MDGPVFISYSRNDKDRVEPVVNHLAEKGIPIWWDDELQPGDKFRERIGYILDKACCVVVAWSTSSVTSSFVIAEADYGLKRGLLIPICLDKELSIPIPFGELHHADLSGPDYLNSKGIKKLVAVIQDVIQYGRPVNIFDGSLTSKHTTLENTIRSTRDLQELVLKIGSLPEIMALEADPIRNIQLCLNQVEKTYKVVINAITKFVLPAVQTRKIRAAPYIKMERGELTSIVQKGHGRCSMILTHYTKVKGLREWILPRLQPDQLLQLDDVFLKLGNADNDLFYEMTAIVGVLTSESRMIANLLLTDQQELARKRILEGRLALEPVEEKLNAAYSELQKTQQLIGSQQT